MTTALARLWNVPARFQQRNQEECLGQTCPLRSTSMESSCLTILEMRYFTLAVPSRFHDPRHRPRTASRANGCHSTGLALATDPTSQRVTTAHARCHNKQLLLGQRAIAEHQQWKGFRYGQTGVVTSSRFLPRGFSVSSPVPCSGEFPHVLPSSRPQLLLPLLQRSATRPFPTTPASSSV